MIGLIRPDEGHVFIDGKDIVNLDAKGMNEVRRKFGMLFQDAALFDSMTVGENVAFPLREHTKLKSSEIKERIAEKLRLVGLPGSESKLPSQLSGGMRKRVGLARAIIMDPEIILYDEPTTGLDPIMTDIIDTLILETQQKLGVTCVVISHDIKATFKVANNVAMLHEGKIIVFGEAKEVKECQDPVYRQFVEGRAEGPIKLV
jgi:phospholipid/cholesterol/gamma-HCH transport system ATP-binding protein